MMISFLLFAVICVASGQYSINMRISSVRVHEGGNVSATCVVVNHLNNPVLLYWVKKSPSGQGHEEVDKHEEVDIGAGSHVNEVFRKTERYHVKQEVIKEFTEFRFTLTITDAQAVDSGEIGCRIPKQNIEVFKKLMVIAQIQSVSLRSKDLDNTHAIAYYNGEQAVFNEGERRKFNCSVNGSHPKPHIKITIGDVDLTDQFAEDVSLISDGSLRGRYYKVERYNTSLKIDHTFRGKNLTCTAYVRDAQTGHAHDSRHEGSSTSSFPPVSSAITVNLKAFAPKFFCTHNVTASLYEHDVELACPVFALPAAENAKFHFNVLGNYNQTIVSGDSFGAYSGKLINETNSDSQKMILKIDSVYPQHFRKYYFEVNNTEGSTVHEIELIRGKRSLVVQNQANHKNFPCFANLAVFGFIMIIHHID